MRMAFFNRKGFWEALTITVAVTAVLLFATWQLASKPRGASADELRSNVVFLSSEGVRFAVAGAAQGIAEKDFTPLQQLMDSFVAAGGKIYTCLPCFNKRELDESAIAAGVEIVGGMKLVEFMSTGAPSVSY